MFIDSLKTTVPYYTELNWTIDRSRKVLVPVPVQLYEAEIVLPFYLELFSSLKYY